jgi:formylglycine-generating enzyme required for sulfatase activity
VYNTGVGITTSQANYNSNELCQCYSPNNWGLYDIHGNVFEWCRDLFDSNYYNTSEATGPDPTGPVLGSGYVVRGGCWILPASQIRSASRVYYGGESYYNTGTGFRLVRR